MTDALKIIAENTARASGGYHLTKRYYDSINDEKPKPERSAQEIIDDVIRKAGLEVV